MKIEFTVYGEPIAQKRHRHFSRGNFTQVYDPSSTDKADFGQVAAHYLPDEPLNEPLMIHIASYFSRPKSHYRTGKYAGMLKDKKPFWHSKKPDADNLGKFVLDSLGKVFIAGERKAFFKDDSLVSVYIHEKIYDEKSPRTEVKIYTLKDYSFYPKINSIYGI